MRQKILCHHATVVLASQKRRPEKRRRKLDDDEFSVLALFSISLRPPRHILGSTVCGSTKHHEIFPLLKDGK
jgi:hypothetical protein